MNEWLKIKIVRDFNKINKNGTNVAGSSGISITNVMAGISSTSGSSGSNLSSQNNIRSAYPTKYLKLIDLVRNTWYNQCLSSNSNFPTGKITIKALNSINIDLLVDITNQFNTKIESSPQFIYTYIENNKIFSKSCVVSESRYIDPLKHIKENPNYMFHVYLIFDNGGRWYKREDKELLKNSRKEKLQELEKIEIEL